MLHSFLNPSFTPFWIFHVTWYWRDGILFLWLTKAIILWSGLFLPLCFISQHFSPQILWLHTIKHIFPKHHTFYFIVLGICTITSFIMKAQFLILCSLGCRALSFEVWLTQIFLECLHWLLKSGLHVLSLCSYRLFIDSHLQFYFCVL